MRGGSVESVENDNKLEGAGPRETQLGLLTGA